LKVLTSGGAAPGPSPSPGASPGASPAPGPTATATATGSPAVVPSLPPNATPQQLVAEATRHYQLAQQAYDNHDLGTYQAEMIKVGQLVNQLGILLGTPAPAGP
jgi:predicted lipid-binding transport protein (Tim44 family)